MPAGLDLRRLEGRIAAIFVGLLLVVQILGFGAIRASITDPAEAASAAELQTGERVLRRLLDQQAGRLQADAKLLAKDCAHRAAGGPSSVQAPETALFRQADRPKAQLLACLDDQRRVVAATREDAALLAPVLGEMAQGKRDATLTVLAALTGRAYQVVAVPVGAGASAGWVLMGVELDRALLDDLQALTSLRSVVLMGDGRGGWRPWVSNLAAAADAELAREPTRRMLAGERVRSRWVSLSESGPKGLGVGLGVVLVRSLDTALGPDDRLQRLQWLLLGLSLLGAGVFFGASVLLGRAIGEPMRGLSAAARRLERGDYDTPVGMPSRLRDVREVRGLARALERMREGVRERAARVNNLAYVDPLTQLPNRARFDQCLRHYLANSATPGAVLVLGLDRFKRVNDVLGPGFGDRLLQAVAERLQSLCAPAHSVLARLAGDEFAILQSGVDVRGASEAALAILKGFERPFCIDDEAIELSAGIGIALFPDHGREVQPLLRHAGLALQAAKVQRCGSLVYHAQLDLGSQDSLALLSELRCAVENQELRLFLQPKVDLQARRLIGAEALVRWQHPTRGLVSPMQFIPFAEQTGFIRLLTAWVMARTAEFSREALNAGLALRLSVNLSTRDLLDQALPAKLEALLAALGVEPGRLCLEITERAIMDDPERALATLEQLGGMGFRLAIDNFGTGHFSLAMLKRLPLDELKIDRSFVMAMAHEPRDVRIVRSAIELAHNLDLTVVAEGLETAQAWEMLAALGCDEGQGYAIAKPMPADQFIAWAQAWQAP